MDNTWSDSRARYVGEEVYHAILQSGAKGGELHTLRDEMAARIDWLVLLESGAWLKVSFTDEELVQSLEGFHLSVEHRLEQLGTDLVAADELLKSARALMGLPPLASHPVNPPEKEPYAASPSDPDDADPNAISLSQRGRAAVAGVPGTLAVNDLAVAAGAAAGAGGVDGAPASDAAPTEPDLASAAAHEVVDPATFTSPIDVVPAGPDLAGEPAGEA